MGTEVRTGRFIQIVEQGIRKGVSVYGREERRGTEFWVCPEVAVNGIREWSILTFGSGMI